MTHELDKLGSWENIIEELNEIVPRVIGDIDEVAPCCEYETEHSEGEHVDCEIFEWLGYSSKAQPSIKEYARISKIIQAYLMRFEPSKIDWNLIKELVSNGPR